MFAFVFIGCKTACKDEAKYWKTDKEFKSEIKMTYRQPYCGGARPSPEMELGTVHDFKHKEFVIKRGRTNHADMEIYKRVTTNENGVFELKLPKGEYAIILPHKAKSFEKFKKEELKKFENKQLKLASDDCLREYWLRADGKITVTGEAEYTVEIKRTCYSDYNYCMQYTGPLPP